jgi:flagellar basal body-associated protein FliL
MKACDCGHWETETVLSRDKVAIIWVSFFVAIFMMACVVWTIMRWAGDHMIIGFSGTLALAGGLATYITFMTAAMQMLNEDKEVFVRNKP